MIEVILSLLYTTLFVFTILKWSFFKQTEIKRINICFFFLLKITAGITITWYYKYYTEGGDMQVYFNDAKIIHHALKTNTTHYLQLLTGINDNDPALVNYYSQMKSSDSTFSESLFNSNRALIRFNAFLMWFSFKYFTVHIIAMCFLSLLGLTSLYIVLTENSGILQKKLLQAALFLTPSLLLWSSSVLKEGFVVFGLGLFAYSLYKLSKQASKSKYIFYAILSLFILLNTKFFFALAILLPFGSYYIVRHYNIKKPFIAYGCCLLTGVPLAWFAVKSITGKDPALMLFEQQQKSIRFAVGGVYLVGNNKVIVWPYDKKHELARTERNNYFRLRDSSNYDYLYIGKFTKIYSTEKSSHDTTSYKFYAEAAPANHIIKTPLINSNINSIVKALPAAFFTTLIHPAFFKSHKIPVFISSLENAVLLIFLLTCFLFIKTPLNNKNILFLCIFTTIILFTLLGLTVPIAGTLVRYKAPVIPFLLAMGIFLLDEEKLKNKFTFLKKIR